MFPAVERRFNGQPVDLEAFKEAVRFLEYGHAEIERMQGELRGHLPQCGDLTAPLHAFLDAHAKLEDDVLLPLFWAMANP